MLTSTLLYGGILITLAGLASLLKPVGWARLTTRRRAAIVTFLGLVIVVVILLLPPREYRIGRAATRLDEFAPVWQFREFHALKIAAPPATVFDAIKHVRPDEIFLFRTLVWIRSGGQPPPQTVLDATRRYESLIDIATHSTFIYLADEPPREFVVGTVVGWPSGQQRTVTPEIFEEPLPPGYALATMNYIVAPDGSGGSEVSTETRVFANSSWARRRFAAYWRVIYPGSAMIRRMWLRAIERRATGLTNP
jgi:hypothetical protein